QPVRMAGRHVAREDDYFIPGGSEMACEVASEESRAARAPPATHGDQGWVYLMRCLLALIACGHGDVLVQRRMVSKPLSSTIAKCHRSSPTRSARISNR